MAASIILGVGMRLTAAGLGAVIAAQFITPLMDTITNSLRLISGPLMFLSIVSGITGMGDASSLGKIGATLVKRFFIMNLICTTAAWLSVSWMFPIPLSGTTAGESAFGNLFSMILGIVPSDIVSPFQTGNAMQIIFLAVCVGVALILLGNSVTETADLLNQVNAIVQLLMTGISKLMPIYIFLCISNLILTSEPSELTQLVAPLVMVTVLCMLLIIAYGFYTSLKTGISPIRLFRA